MLKRTFLPAIILCVWAAGDLRAQSPSTVREEVWQIGTYPFSSPDPVPGLVRNPKIYPYFCFDGYTAERTQKPWKVVCLENEYIKVYVLPEVGGKVYGAVEKSTGKQFIYTNDVLKFRRIALRGPWTSGGIEFNFGLIGHTPSTATPVDYLIRRNPDSSATCVVGAMDLPSRTRWTVAITLPKDKAYFETNAQWYNPGPFDQSYYSWITAAISARRDLEYFYPGNAWVPHSNSINLAPWPVNGQGRDLSWYRNNDFEGSKSYFVLGQYQNFFGAYWHDLDFGMGHWATYDDMPGKKIWIWSLFRDGGIWETLLTDSMGQYTEPQAGRLFSQVDHEFFPPSTFDSWQELWFPVKEIGGIRGVSPSVAMNVSSRGDSLVVSLCALASVAQDLEVAAGSRLIFREALNLRPMDVWKKSLAWKESAESIQVRVGSELLFKGGAKALDLSRPIRYQEPKEDTPEGMYQAGEFLEKRRDYQIALSKYLACLQKEPNHIQALVRTAALYGRRGEYSKGLGYAGRALQIQMYSPSANYIYGILSRRVGDLLNAKETMGWAARSMEYRSNAYGQLSEMNMLEKNYDQSAKYARKAIDFNKENLNAYHTLAAAMRKLSRPEEGRIALEAVLAIDPLDHAARFEKLLLDGNKEGVKQFGKGIQNEFPDETCLEIAIWYASLGMQEEACLLLESAPPRPMVTYWLAYLLREKNPKESLSLLAKANASSPEFVFPFREEAIPVLEWARKTQDHWKPAYYLALVLWSKGREDEARSLLGACGNPGFSPLYQARAFLNKGIDTLAVRTDLERAVAQDPDSWRNWHALVSFMQDKGEAEGALDLAEKVYLRFPREIVSGMDYAGGLLNCGKPEECLSVLRSMNVLPYEGSWEAQDLSMRANLSLAIGSMKAGNYEQAATWLDSAREYPEHLGSGRPYEPDERLLDYLAGICHKKLGHRAAADSLHRAVRDYTLRHWMSWGSAHFFGALALRDLGEGEKALQLVNDWKAQSGTDSRTKWYIAKFNGDAQTAGQLGQELKRDKRFRLQMDAVSVLE